MTYGLGRAEILSAQANGVTLLILGVLIVVDAIRRLVSPPHVDGRAGAGRGARRGRWSTCVAAAILARGSTAGRTKRSLNVEGSYRHIAHRPVRLHRHRDRRRGDPRHRLSRAPTRSPRCSSPRCCCTPLRPAQGLRPGVHGGGARGPRPRGDRPHARRPPGRRRGPRPARLGGHLGLPGALGARRRACRRRLPRAAGAACRRCCASASAIEHTTLQVDHEAGDTAAAADRAARPR